MDDFLRRHDWWMRFGVLCILGVFVGTVPGAAQVPATDTVDVDTIPLGYDQIRNQLRALQPIPQPPPERDGDDMDGVDMLEIDGLVVDETQTRIGRDFYEVFYGTWEMPDGAFNFTIVVSEQPVPNLGTRIIVRVDDEVAFQAQLQPSYDFIQQAARFAVRRVQQMIERAEGGRRIY